MNESHYKFKDFMKRRTERFVMRLMRFGLLSALAFCALFWAGLHAHAAVSGDFEYMDNPDGTVTITYYHDPVKCDAHLVVPARLDGKTVTAIGDRAFRFVCITGVTLPDTVKSIGKEAFEITSILKNVNLPSGLVSIGDYAFNYNQIEQITLPDSLEHIGFSAFSYNKLKSVSLPSGLKTMDQFAFWHNEITSVSFSENMTTIPKHTFVENKITSITIPKYITEIGSHAFSANPLTEVTILSAATQLSRDSILEVGSPFTVYGHSESPAQKFAFTNSYLFEPIKMKVIYDGNNHISGDVPVDNNLYVRREQATVLGNTGLLTKPGHRFDGWNTAPDGSGEDYAPGSTVSIEEEDVILFAQWTPVNAETPAVSDAYTAENRQSASGLVITPDPADSGNVKYYKISAIVGGTLYKHDGTTQIANGDFITVAEGGAGLKFTPAAHANTAAGDTFSFQVQAAPNVNGTFLSNPVTAFVHVTEVNDAPVAVDDAWPNVMKGAGRIIIEFEDLLMNDFAGPTNESFQSLTIVDVGNAVGGTVEIINRHIEFDLDSAFVGLAKFSYTL